MCIVIERDGQMFLLKTIQKMKKTERKRGCLSHKKRGISKKRKTKKQSKIPRILKIKYRFEF
jgi:hypothetical protein